MQKKNPEGALDSHLNRREFLRRTAAGVGLAATGVGALPLEATADPEMPTIKLGSHKVSRLVLGSNPILGYSHVSRLMSRVMTEYYTLENIGKLLNRCLAVGINTWQTSADEKVDQSLEKLRNSGRDIQWIFLASDPHLEDAQALKELVKRNKPIAIVHHGGVSDRLWRDRKIEKARDFTKRVKDLGIMAAISAHNPAVIRHAEERGWNLDFYMTCFYRVSRSSDEVKAELKEEPLGELFLPSDPPRMCEVIRQVKRPCLAFKILAAGRNCEGSQQVEKAFEFAFRNIKPTDAVIVGMFPRFRDEPAQDAQLAKRFSCLSS